MIKEPDMLYAVQCCRCLCMIGVSENKTWEKDIYCMICGKEFIAENEESKEELNEETKELIGRRVQEATVSSEEVLKKMEDDDG